MRVKVFEVDQDTLAETYLHTSDFLDMEFASDEDQQDANYELGEIGRAWIGGGAAPLFLLTRAE